MKLKYPIYKLIFYEFYIIDSSVVKRPNHQHLQTLIKSKTSYNKYCEDYIYIWHENFILDLVV